MPTLNELKIYVADNGQVVFTDKDIITGSSTAANRVVLVTPWAIGDDTYIRTKFRLANGNPGPVKRMSADLVVPTEEFQGETWNRYYYDLKSDVLSSFHPTTNADLDEWFQQVQAVEGGLPGEAVVRKTSTVVTLSIDPSIVDADSDLTISDFDELSIDISNVEAGKLNNNFTSYPSALEVFLTDKLAITDVDGGNIRNLGLDVFIDILRGGALSLRTYPTAAQIGETDPVSGRQWTRRVLVTSDDDYGAAVEIPYGDLAAAPNDWKLAVGEWELASLSTADVGVFTGDYEDLNIQINITGRKVGGNGAVRFDPVKKNADGTYVILTTGVEIPVNFDANTPQQKGFVIPGLFNIDPTAGESWGIATFAKRDTSAATTLYATIMGDPVVTYTTADVPVTNLIALKQDKVENPNTGRVATINVDGNSVESEITLDELVVDADLADYQLRSEKNIAGGYIGFDEAEKLANKDVNGGYVGRGAAGEVSIPGAVTINGLVTILNKLIVSGDIEFAGGNIAEIKTIDVLIKDNDVILNGEATGVPPGSLFGGLTIKRSDDEGTYPAFKFGYEELREAFVMGKVGGTFVVAAAREDVPIDGGIAIWDAATKKFVTINGLNFTDLLDTPGALVPRQIFRVAEDGLSIVGGRENNNGNTGVVDADGLVPSINAGDPTLFDVSAGIYQIIDETVDPPKTNVFNYAGSTNNPIPGIGTRVRTYIALDENEAFVYLSNLPSESDYNTIVPFAIAFHPFGEILSIEPIGFLATQPAKNALEVDGYTSTNKKGNTYTDNGANTEISVSAGEIKCLGGNRVNNPDSVNVVFLNAEAPVNFWLIYRDGLGGITFDNNAGAGYTVFDQTWFDDGTGVLASIPGGGNNATIHRILRSPRTGRTYVIIGQNSYSSFSDAQAARVARTDIITGIPDFIFEDLVFLSLLTVTNNVPDFSNTSATEFFDIFNESPGAAGGVATSLPDSQILNTSGLGGLSGKSNQFNINQYFEYVKQGQNKKLALANLVDADFTLAQAIGFAMTVGDIFWLEFATSASGLAARANINGVLYPVVQRDATALAGTEVSDLLIPCEWDGTNFVDILDLVKNLGRITTNENKIASIDVVDLGGTFVMPTAGYITVGTVRESGAITVAGLTVTVGSKYDVDISDTDSSDLTKVEGLEKAGIIKFIRVSDTEIKVRLKDETKLVASINMVISKVKDDGGVV